jgi:hypothetical protein
LRKAIFLGAQYVCSPNAAVAAVMACAQVELEPWHQGGFELNPESLSAWGHELVGPIVGPSVRTPKEVLELYGGTP